MRPLEKLYRRIIHHKEKKRAKKERLSSSVSPGDFNEKFSKDSASQTDFSSADDGLEHCDNATENGRVDSVTSSNGSADLSCVKAWRISSKIEAVHGKFDPDAAQIPVIVRVPSAIHPEVRGATWDHFRTVPSIDSAREASDEPTAIHLADDLQEFEALPEIYRHNRIQQQQNATRIRELTEKLATAEELCILQQSNHETEVQQWKSRLEFMKETEVTRQQSAREMQERLTELETNRQILASQMSILHSEKQDLLRQLDIAHYETAELKKLPTPDDYSIVKTENRHLEREISRLEKSLQEISQELADKNEVVLSLSVEKESLVAQVEKERLQHRQLQDMSNYLDTANQDLRARLATDLKASAGALQRFRAEQSQAMEIALKENRMLQERIAQCQLQCERSLAETALRSMELEQTKASNTVTVRNYQAEVGQYRQLLDAADKRYSGRIASLVQNGIDTLGEPRCDIIV